MADGGLTVILPCGLPFAGKSTLARALASRLDFELIEVDGVLRDLDLLPASGPIPREAWMTAYRESYRRLEASLEDGRSVILDATNYRRVQRDVIRRKAARHGAETVVVWLDLSRAEVDARRAANRLRPSRPDVRDEDLDLVARDLQPPGQDEMTLRYCPEEGVDSLVRGLERLWVGEAAVNGS